MRSIIKGFLAVTLLLAGCFASAQVTAPVQNVSLSYNAIESLTLTLSTTSLSLQQQPVYTALSATVAYNFAQSRTINMSAYFANGANALASGTNIIPAADVFSYQTTADPSGTAVPCTQGQTGTGGGAVGVAGSSCYNFLIAPVGAGTGSISATEMLALAQQPYTAGTYTGTLLVAVAAL
jgi:hypothetical protein